MPIALRYVAMALTASFMIGFFPIYWAMFSEVSSNILLFYRSFWSCIFLLPVIIFCKGKLVVQEIPFFLLSATCLGANWLVYIYAINHNHVIEASMAYFIFPLVSTLLGFFFFKEPISKKQQWALLCVALGLSYLFVVKHIFPVYSLVISLTFACYALIGKLVKTSVFIRMAIECLLISLFLMLCFQSPMQLTMHFLQFDVLMRLLLLMGGVITVMTFACFNSAVKRLLFH